MFGFVVSFSPTRDCFSVRISSSECHFLCEYDRFLCSVKMAPFRVKLAAKKKLKQNNNKKSLQGHFQILLSVLHTIWLPYHLVGIIGIKDETFFSNFSAFPQRRH